MKAQEVRLFDVFVLGPAMVIAGDRLHRRGDNLLGLFMIGGGLATVAYNWANYRKVSESPGRSGLR